MKGRGGRGGEGERFKERERARERERGEAGWAVGMGERQKDRERGERLRWAVREEAGETEGEREVKGWGGRWGRGKD